MTATGRRRPAGAGALALAIVLVLVLTTGCGRDGDPGAGRTLTVFAASSLTEAFRELGRRFERSHPGVAVTFRFGASSALAQQLVDGAPADVVATADEETMAKVVGAGRAVDPVIVARNRLALIVERGNPRGIRSLADAARPGVVLVLCAREVPCGRLAAAALAAAGVTARPASLEANVKGVVAKVTLGEADAGIVYATDVRAAGDAAEGVDLPGGDDPALAAAYPMAAVTAAPNGADGRAWIRFVRSDEGQRVLASYGFLRP